MNSAQQRIEWRVRPAVPQEIARPLMDSGLTPILCQLLYNRGFHSPDQAQAFLSAEEVSHDAALLPGLQQAVERLRKAVRDKERVAVFGDFDVDGITGTAIMARALTSLGIEVIPYIPHRVDEGHGLNTDAVSYLAGQGATLLVTVDTGVTAFAEVAAAQDMGVDVIITDHHLAPEGAPDAYAIIDPRLPDSTYPFPHLTGAGLAYKLCKALLQSFGSSVEEQVGTLISLAALGTVADVAPLLDENRSLVRRGLEELARSSSTGLQAMFRTARIEDVILRCRNHRVGAGAPAQRRGKVGPRRRKLQTAGHQRRGGSGRPGPAAGTAKSRQADHDDGGIREGAVSGGACAAHHGG